MPAKGKTGTVIYGEGKEHGADDLDYSVTAPTGATHLAIYYYDSSANSSVPTLTVNDLTFEESLPESIAISSHIFSATQPNRVSKNKNLIVYPFLNTAAGSQGVIYTNNKDGTYTGNGTATANSFFAVTEDGDGSGAISLEPGTYTLSGCPAGGSLTTYKTMISISYDNWANTIYYNETGSGVTFTLTKPAKAKVTLSVLKDITVSNIVFKPQLEKGSTATSFVKGDATGQVWFKTGTASNAPFNIIKKHTAMVYVVSTSQYHEGAWRKKAAQIYQGTEWKSFAESILYLFNDETDVTAASGGWEKWSGDGTLAITDGVMKMSAAKGSGTTVKDGLYRHLTAVDASLYNTVIVETADISAYANNRCQIRVCDAEQNILATVTLKTGTTSYTLDISSITVECYVCFRVRSYWDGSEHAAASVSVNQVKLTN